MCGTYSCKFNCLKMKNRQREDGGAYKETSVCWSRRERGHALSAACILRREVMEADKETAESYLKAVLDVIEQGDLESSRAKVSYPLS